MGVTAAAIEIAALDATAQAGFARKGEVTAVELVDWAIQRIEALDPELNAVATRAFEDSGDDEGLCEGGHGPERPCHDAQVEGLVEHVGGAHELGERRPEPDDGGEADRA